MPNRFYEKVGGNQIRIWQIIESFQKDELKGDIDELKELESLSDGAKQQLIDNSSDLLGNNPDVTKTPLEIFDTINRKKKQKLQDLLDYWVMDTIPASGLDDIQTSWIDLSKLAQNSGAVIKSVCGEDVGDDAIKAVNGSLVGFWQHDLDEQHSITIDLTYPKVIDAIRLWIPNTNTQFQLTGVDIRGATSITGLANNLLATNISFSGDGQWVAHVFSGGKKRIRYIRLENINTNHAQNEIRVREIELRALTKFFTLEGD